MPNTNKMSRKELVDELQVLENLPFPATALHVNSVIIEANQEFADLIGYELDEVPGLNAWVLFPPSSFETLMTQLNDKSIDTYEVMAHERSGRQFPVQIKAENLMHNNEPARRIYTRDITKIVEIRERLGSLRD